MQCESNVRPWEIPRTCDDKSYRKGGRKVASSFEPDFHRHMSQSTPALNFDNDDSSFVFDVPEFEHSLRSANEDDEKFLSIKEASAALSRSPRKSHGKRRSSLNMRATMPNEHDKEMKDLFKEWKQSQQKISSPQRREKPKISPVKSKQRRRHSLEAIPQAPNLLEPKSNVRGRPTERASSGRAKLPGISPNKTKNGNRRHGSMRASTSDIPDISMNSFDPSLYEVHSSSSPSSNASSPVKSRSDTKTPSPTKKKKVVTKLKASDLNISETKKKKIEHLFRKLKQDNDDSNSSPQEGRRRSSESNDEDHSSSSHGGGRSRSLERSRPREKTEAPPGRSRLNSRRRSRSTEKRSKTKDEATPEPSPPRRSKSKERKTTPASPPPPRSPSPRRPRNSLRTRLTVKPSPVAQEPNGALSRRCHRAKAAAGGM